MASEEINPWSAKIVEDFLYFNCPECDVKDQFKDSFIQHALESHPNSRPHFLGCVKIELLDVKNCVDTLFNLVHDRVQNSSGSGLKFSTFLASGRVRVSNKHAFRFRVGFGYQK